MYSQGFEAIMAKDSITRPRRPDPLPRPRRDEKATRKKGGGDRIREGRLVMRVHHDLLDLVDIRARERGESRSRFIERLLVAFLQADPRNPKIDPWGLILGDGPAIGKVGEAVRFEAAWLKWSTLNETLLGLRVPDGWLDEEPGYVDAQRGGRQGGDDD
jgi:hypothetical protein